MFQRLRKYKLEISVMFLVVFHLIGLIGILAGDSPEEFARLSWMNLLVSGLFLFINHEKWNAKIILAIVGVGVLGYVFEVIGVSTGMIFGEYEYGESLGQKILEVPLVIGLNWAMLCYFTVYAFSKWIKPWWLLSTLSAFSLVILDFIIEPVAIQLDFWQWNATEIPVQNYLAWFVLAVVFNKVVVLTKGKSENKLAIYLFGIQLLFFIVLRFNLT